MELMRCGKDVELSGAADDWYPAGVKIGLCGGGGGSGRTLLLLGSSSSDAHNNERRPVQRKERDTSKKVTMVHLGLALCRRYASGHIVIRMALGGCTNRPVYNIVTMFNKRARDAPYLEQVGTYDPMPNAWGQRLVGVNLERISYWLASGAQLSTPVAKLLGLSGYLPLHPMTITAAERKQRQHEKQQRAEAEASRVEEKAES